LRSTIGSLVRISSELEEDAIVDIVDTIANEIGVAFAALEDDCAFNGDGTSTYGQMRGISTIVLDGNHNKAKVTASANTYGALIAADIGLVMGAVRASAVPNAAWFVSQIGFANAFSRLSAGSGFLETRIVDGISTPFYQGFPVILTQKLPQLTTTLTGKVMCGYQGWFTAPGDGSQRGWTHYGPGDRFGPGHCSIDLWPDVGELDDDEKFSTPFRHADGSTAYLFSSHCEKTVLRHFRWMREYGIDGVFVQRFAVETISAVNLNHFNTVLANCREGANRYGRAYAVMYDLSGLREGKIEKVIDDWKLLVDRIAHWQGRTRQSVFAPQRQAGRGRLGHRF
jgi:hypothetical protein